MAPFLSFGMSLNNWTRGGEAVSMGGVTLGLGSKG